jgi:hypothetical protein
MVLQTGVSAVERGSYKILFENDTQLPRAPPADGERLEILGVSMLLSFAFYYLPKGVLGPVSLDDGAYSRRELRKKLADMGLLPWVQIFKNKIQGSQNADELSKLYVEDPIAGIGKAQQSVAGFDVALFRPSPGFLGCYDEWDRKLFDPGFLSKVSYAHFEITPFEFRDVSPSPSGFVPEGTARAFLTFYASGVATLSLLFTIVHDSIDDIHSAYRFGEKELFLKTYTRLAVDDILFLADIRRTIETTRTNQTGRLEDLAKGTMVKILAVMNGWGEISLEEAAARLACPPPLIGRANCIIDVWRTQPALTKVIQLAKDHVWEIEAVTRLDANWRTSRPTLPESTCFSPSEDFAIFLGSSTSLELDGRPNLQAIGVLGLDRVTSRVTEWLLSDEFLLDFFDDLVSQQIRSLPDAKEEDYSKEAEKAWVTRSRLLERLESLPDIMKRLSDYRTVDFLRISQKSRELDVRSQNLRGKLDELGSILTSLTEIVSMKKNDEIGQRTERTQFYFGIISTLFSALVVASIVLPLSQLFLPNDPVAVTAATALSAIVTVIVVLLAIRKYKLS